MMLYLVIRWARLGGKHVEFPAGVEGSEDEEAKMAEGVTVLVFFLAKEGAGTNAFDKKLEAFIHGINVGCGDGEEIGDRREVGDVAKGLERAFDEVGQPSVEEGVLHRELVFVMLLGRVCRKPFVQPRSSTTRKERAVLR
jgi:hypothetical protein